MKDGFANNPFQDLAGQLHLQDSAKPAKASAKKVLSRQKNEGCGNLDDSADQAMFLRAVGRLENPKVSEGRVSFLTFGEQCQELGARKDYKKQRARKRSHLQEGMTVEKPKDQHKELADERHALSREESPEESFLAEDEFSQKEWQSFLKAVDGVEPLKEQRGRIVVPENTPQKALAVSCDFAQMLESRLEFQLICRDEYLEGQIAGLDQLIMDKLRNGSFSPEAHLDLHGFTVVQAFEALRGFIKSSWYKGLRNLLIIPGRGRNSLDGIGVLRSRLPQWLTQEPLKRVVLAFCTAQPTDGGPGSIYVLLRKYRKKGRIFWERLPMDEELFDL